MTADDPTITAAKAGDAEAWRQLYRAHAGRLVLWLENQAPVDSAVSADDLAAETWLVAARRIPEFSGSSSDFAGWLFGIGRRLAANARRLSGRRRTDPTDEVSGLDPRLVPGPDVTLPERDWLRGAVRSLPPRERDVVVCLDVIGLDVAATTHALGITAVAVRVARHRGLRKLRAILGEAVPERAGGSALAQPAVRAASSASR